MWKTTLLLIPLFLMMTSCAGSMGTKPELSKIQVKPELLEYCIDPPKLASGTMGQVVIYIHDIKYAYVVCRDRHKALSDTVKEIISSEN
jgi:hypothetical protein